MYISVDTDLRCLCFILHNKISHQWLFYSTVNLLRLKSILPSPKEGRHQFYSNNYVKLSTKVYHLSLLYHLQQFYLKKFCSNINNTTIQIYSCFQLGKKMRTQNLPCRHMSAKNSRACICCWLSSSRYFNESTKHSISFSNELAILLLAL